MTKTKSKKQSGINTWPEDDRPREKLLKKGARSLSNSELLAILLRTGTSGVSAIDLARDVLKSSALSFRFILVESFVFKNITKYENNDSG